MNVKHNQLQNATTICGGNLKKLPNRARRKEAKKIGRKRSEKGMAEGTDQDGATRNTAGQQGRGDSGRTGERIEQQTIKKITIQKKLNKW